MSSPIGIRSLMAVQSRLSAPLDLAVEALGAAIAGGGCAAVIDDR